MVDPKGKIGVEPGRAVLTEPVLTEPVVTGPVVAEPAITESTIELPPLPEVRGSALGDRSRAVDLKGQGARSVLALQLEAPIDVPVVHAKTVEELLALLPTQTEIARLERAIARFEVDGKIPLSPLHEILAALPASYAAAMEEIPRLTRYFNPVELITIDDVARVKEEFLAKAEKGEIENPSFTYERSTAALRKTLAARGLTVEGVEARLKELRAGLERDAPPEALADLMRTALLEKIDDDLATIELYRGLTERDDLRVKRAFAEKYGSGVDDALYDAARTVYGYLVGTQAHAKENKQALIGRGRIEPELAAYMASSEKMPADEFADAVHWMLERYYDHYRERTGREVPEEAKFQVLVDPKYSSIDVRDKSSEGPIIGIPAKDRSYKQYLELLRHEIDQHVRQSLNGQLMFGFGGGGLKVDEETWYEGLAKHREIQFMREMFGDESSPTLPYYTFAIRWADEGKSFAQVFEGLRRMRLDAGSSEKTAAANAWNATYRAFRGHSDTSNRKRFGLPKDQAYLRGWMLEAQLDARGLSHLNEAAICKLGGLELVARFDFGPDDLPFPDLNLTQRYFEEVMRPRLLAEAGIRKPRREVP